MSVIIEFIQNLSVSEVISYLIGLTSILLSAVYHYRSKRIQEPRFLKRSAVITEEMISQDSLIRIMFGEQKLERLTVSKVAFWNTGITLKKEDVSSSCPFRLELDSIEHNFLDCRVCYSECENDVDCSISDDKKTVSISFDYLAKNQGFVLKVLHTGKGSKSFSVKGSMKNEGELKKTVPTIAKMNSFLYQHISALLHNLFLIYLFLIIGIIVVVVSCFKIGSVRDSIEVSAFDILPYMIFGIFCILFGLIFGLLNQSGNMPRKIHKAFWEEL